MAPIVSFYRVLAVGLPPVRATRSALGQLPVKAYRFCEAVTTASGFGWHVFPPLDFSLITQDGHNVLWSMDEQDWYQLDAAQYPGALERFDDVAPEDCRGYCPPWLLATATPRMVQIWSGFLVSTVTDWSLLVRAPANVAANPGIRLYEGIIETDRWLGPLFTNVRLARTNVAVRFKAHEPFLQIQPVPRWLYGEQTHEAFSVVPLSELDWSRYRETVVESGARPLGHYAVSVRKRRAAEP